MYELIPDPTYEHINRGPAGKINQRNRNSTVKEQEVTSKSHDIQYHVLKQSTNAKEGTSHDLQGNPSIVKDQVTLKTTLIMCLKILARLRVTRSLTMKVQMSKQPKWKTPILHQVGKTELIFPKQKRYRMNKPIL